MKTNIIDAARAVINARDHFAEHGTYPPDTVGAGQCFDDWAADVLQNATHSSEFKISAHGKPEDTLPVTVVQNNTGVVFGVEIEIPGYGRPVYLERNRETGRPVLYVSADPNSDDISHKIPLPAFDISGS
jgi:hypothetical protein